MSESDWISKAQAIHGNDMSLLFILLIKNSLSN